MKERFSNFRAFADGIEIQGNFIVTDPCYFFGEEFNSNDDEWTDFLKEIEKLDCTVAFDFGGKTGFLCSTAFGDGIFDVMQVENHVGEFGVDSGMFGIFAIDGFSKEEIKYITQKIADSNITLGCIVEDVYGNAKLFDGDAQIGETMITTGGGLTEEPEEPEDLEE